MNVSIKHKLLGEIVKVISSKNKTLEGLEGEVVFDSKNTLILVNEKGETTLLKSSLIELALPKKGIAIHLREFAENKKRKKFVRKNKK